MPSDNEQKKQEVIPSEPKKPDYKKLWQKMVEGDIEYLNFTMEKLEKELG